MNKPLNTELLDRAIVFAVKAHAGTERRGKGFPYIVHPMEAVEIVATITPDQEILAAAALHDVVEDCGIAVDEIRKEFGDRVASLVASESETPVEGKSDEESWRERKQAAINRLQNTSHDGKIVALGDKLSNMRAIYRDYCVQGDELWNLFHAPGGKADHEWHYRGLAGALRELSGTFAYNEFAELIDKVFGRPKPELISMDDYEESGDGFTAVSYNNKNGRTMIKLYADFMPKFIPAKELESSWHIQQMGIKIPEAYRLVTDGKRIGVEFQRITGKRSFARAISQEPERAEFYAEEFARQAKDLHSRRCLKEFFPDIKEIFHGVTDKSELLSDDEKRLVHTFINDTPDADTCLHGDMHFGNIITTGEETFWIDLGDFSYGHPNFDLGMFYLQTHCLPDELCNKLYHFGNDMALRVWNRFAEVYFEGKPMEEIDRMLSPYASLFIMLFDTRSKVFDCMRDFVRNHLPVPPTP